MDNCLEIIDFGDIKTNKLGEYRHITLYDINNNKSIDYVIFDSSKHYAMWESIDKNEIDKVYFPGRIVTVTLTKDLLTKVNINIESITFYEGQEMDIVIWDDFSGNTEEVTIKGLINQLWQLKKYY